MASSPLAVGFPGVMAVYPVAKNHRLDRKEVLKVRYERFSNTLGYVTLHTS